MLVAWAGLALTRHPRVLYTGIQVPNECVFAPIATDRSDRRWFTLTEGSPLNWSRLILQHFEVCLVAKKCLTPNPEVSEHVKVPRVRRLKRKTFVVTFARSCYVTLCLQMDARQPQRANARLDAASSRYTYTNTDIVQYFVKGIDDGRRPLWLIQL
jgi:hypothetical protein